MEPNEPVPRPRTPPTPSSSQPLKRSRLPAHQPTDHIDQVHQLEPTDSRRLPPSVNRTPQLTSAVLDNYIGLEEYKESSKFYSSTYIGQGWEVYRRPELCHLFTRFSQEEIEFVRQFSQEEVKAGLQFRHFLPLYCKIHQEEHNKCKTLCTTSNKRTKILTAGMQAILVSSKNPVRHLSSLILLRSSRLSVPFRTS
jgi:hypothetical protein